MVIEEIKGGETEAEKPKGNRAEKASETLLALVRGEKRRKTASMINVDLKKDQTDFLPSNPEPRSAAVLMIPGQWKSAQEFRPVNRSSAR